MPYILKRYYPARNIFFALGEGTIIFLALNAVFLLMEGKPAYMEDFLLYWSRAFIVTFIYQLCLYYFDLYDHRRPSQFMDTASRITMVFGFGCILLAVLYYFLPRIMISTKIFWVAYMVICASIALWRGIYSMLLERRMFAQQIVILGTGELSSNISSEINSRRDSGYKIVAYVAVGGIPEDSPTTVPILSREELPQFCNEKGVERIVTALDDRRGKTPIKELFACKINGTTIEDGIAFYESQTGKIMVEKMDPAWIIYSDGFRKGRLPKLFKRGGDVFLASLGILLTLPLSLATAILIKLDSPGPVFFMQDRTGYNGKTYKIIKFRSMRADAEKDGPKWASENDDRIGRVGSFIRKVRLDEIPQLWNVLKGEMSMVGPRPEQPFFVNQLEKTIPYYSLRHSVKPGITGWAQVFYPYGATEEDALRKLEYDLYYIKNVNLRMDLWIVFQTIKIVLFRKGAR